MSHTARLCTLLAFAGILSAQNVTNSTVKVGGPGAIGSEGGDPPTLNNGAIATAELDFNYTQSTGRLVLTVRNTTPVKAGESTALITQIYFNAPPIAVTGMNLISQTGAGGAVPSFPFSFDADIFTAPSPNQVSPFGSFSCGLANGDIKGGISNPAATDIAAPPGTWVVGPAVFTFQVLGSTAGLTAHAFADALSSGHNGNYTTAAVKFQAGGPGGEGSAKIGTKPDCSPSSFVVGAPRIGHTVTLYFSGAPGCKGCVFVTLNPTPTVIGPLHVPAGPPYLEVAGGPVGNQPLSVPITIPNLPGLIGVKVYFFLAVVGPGSVTVEFSPRYEFTILP